MCNAFRLILPEVPKSISIIKNKICYYTNEITIENLTPVNLKKKLYLHFKYMMFNCDAVG